MDWLAERRRMLGGSKKFVNTFEEFISDSSVIQSFYSYSSNVTVPVNTKNCVRYIISMGVYSSTMSIDKIDNGVVTNLFLYGGSYAPDNITVTAYDDSSILFNNSCLGVVIDPLDFSISSCDEFFRSAAVIEGKQKGESLGNTVSISAPYRKGASYVIAAMGDKYANAAKLVKVDSDISFTTLASYGYDVKLLTGVDLNGNAGNWWVYCYTEDYQGVSDDVYAEAIYALSFDE